MKKIYTILILFIILLVTGCDPTPIENHKNSIIYAKSKSNFHNWVTIKVKNKEKFEFKTITVMDLDYNKYQVGDTIK